MLRNLRGPSSGRSLLSTRITGVQHHSSQVTSSAPPFSRRLTPRAAARPQWHLLDALIRSALVLILHDTADQLVILLQELKDGRGGNAGGSQVEVRGRRRADPAPNPSPAYRLSPPRSGPCRKLLPQVSGSRSLTRWIVSWLTLALPRSQSGAKMTDMLQKTSESRAGSTRVARC